MKKCCPSCAPNALEIEASKILRLMDELDGEGPPSARGFADGYHVRAYRRIDSQAEVTALNDSLCKRLEKVGDVIGYSLEMQTWWRDHQDSEVKRKVQEKAVLVAARNIRNYQDESQDGCYSVEADGVRGALLQEMFNAIQRLDV